MTKYTQKQLRSLVRSGVAVDATHHSCKDYDEVRRREGWLEKIGYAVGVYGCSGLLFRGHNTGALYAITHRTQAIFIYG